jgi:histidyl-tRNA synthetase
MPTFQAPRGTTDRLPAEQKYWRYIEGKAMDVARRFGYGRIDSPMFEDARLFVRGVGEGTDIVEKEMYIFEDRGGDMLTLRAEGTAPVCRAYLEHGMHNQTQPVRLYYICPVFRYERPQAGRFRQHHQFGVEAIGDGDPSVDAEVIGLAWAFMHEIGLTDITLLTNSIGDGECRPEYIAALMSYYQSQTGNLCPDCRQRLERNPLRLLDCKVETCRALGEEAPKSVECLCAECQTHWDRVRSYLDAAGIPNRVDHRLVRGLDYYTRTVFEIQPAVEGAQSTICGGGRYDGLIEQLGGRSTPGIGFGSGIERLALNLRRAETPVPDEPSPRYLIATIGEDARIEGVRLATRMRNAGVGAILANGGRALRGQMRQANALGVAATVILGDDEVRDGTVVVRDMQTSSQQTLPVDQFLNEASAG